MREDFSPVIGGLFEPKAALCVLEAVCLDGIRHDDTTVWPEGFDPPSSGGLDDHE